MVKGLTREQEITIVRIRFYREIERAKKADARAKAKEYERKLIADAETQTNELILRLHEVDKTPISTIARLAFNTSNRHTIYRRIKAAKGEK